MTPALLLRFYSCAPAIPCIHHVCNTPHGHHRRLTMGPNLSFLVTFHRGPLSLLHTEDSSQLLFGQWCESENDNGVDGVKKNVGPGLEECYEILKIPLGISVEPWGVAVSDVFEHECNADKNWLKKKRYEIFWAKRADRVESKVDQHRPLSSVNLFQDKKGDDYASDCSMKIRVETFTETFVFFQLEPFLPESKHWSLFSNYSAHY